MPKMTMEQIAVVAAGAWGISLPLSNPGNTQITTSDGKTLTDTLITAVAVAWAESTGDPGAHNPVWPDDSYGLWQINMRGQLGEARLKQFQLTNKTQLFDPVVNAKAAHQVWLNAGRSFSPWSTYTSRAYLAFVPAARQAVTGGLKSDPTSDISTFFNDILDSVFDFLSKGALRVGGFVGGAALIVGAVVLMAKGGMK